MDEWDVLLRAKLNGETARIPFKELQHFFAAGKTVFVAKDQDLVDVAWLMSTDNADGIRALMDSAGVGPVADHQARQWIDDDAGVWCVVIRPWVLVQSV